jgi:hypothetical protein
MSEYDTDPKQYILSAHRWMSDDYSKRSLIRANRNVWQRPLKKLFLKGLNDFYYEIIDLLRSSELGAFSTVSHESYSFD